MGLCQVTFCIRFIKEQENMAHFTSFQLDFSERRKFEAFIILNNRMKLLHDWLGRSYSAIEKKKSVGKKKRLKKSIKEKVLLKKSGDISFF